MPLEMLAEDMELYSEPLARLFNTCGIIVRKCIVRVVAESINDAYNRVDKLMYKCGVTI